MDKRETARAGLNGQEPDPYTKSVERYFLHLYLTAIKDVLKPLKPVFRRYLALL